MRLANLGGRAVLIEAGNGTGDTAVDVATSSGGRFGPDPQQLFTCWPQFRDWSRTAAGQGGPVDHALLGPPVPHPSQVFAVGFNYVEHVDEASAEPPRHPTVFTKFPSCLTGPRATVEVTPRMLLDWEVELVVVIGEGGRDVPVDRGWAHVAGLMVGQDLSDRRLQMRGPAPAQYSLGKSCPGFGPTGPWLVTPDELADPDDLAIVCRLGEDEVQSSRTGRMHFTVPDLVARLSAAVQLRAGDLIFTGTPAGVGAFREPQRWIRPGEVLTSRIEGIGELVTTFAGVQP